MSELDSHLKHTWDMLDLWPSVRRQHDTLAWQLSDTLEAIPGPMTLWEFRVTTE